MTTTSVNTNSELWQLLAALNQNSAGSTSSTTSTSSTDASSSASSTSGSTQSGDCDSSSVSTIGKLFSELDKLSKSNPTEFKKITSEIASELTAAAGNSTDSTETDLLKSLASNFSKASQSGNFSDLFSNSNDSISSIFSSALSQIQTDLGSSSTSQS